MAHWPFLATVTSPVKIDPSWDGRNVHGKLNLLQTPKTSLLTSNVFSAGSYPETEPHSFLTKEREGLREVP